MTQLRRQPSSAGVASCCQQHTMGVKPATTSARGNKSIAQITSQKLNGRTGDQLNPRPSCSRPEAIHHRRGAIGLRKHPAIVFLHQIQATVGEPCNGITTGKAAERSPQGALATGVVAHQLAWIPTGMGHIAATTTAQSNLREWLGRGFQDQHALQTSFSGCDRRHETGSAAADHQQINFSQRVGRQEQRRYCSSAYPSVEVRH